MKSKLTRQSNVEILRTLACFIVISVHIKFGLTRDDSTLDMGRTLISCLVADGVGLFWMISGFFISRPIKSYSKHLKKSFLSIILPTLVYLAFTMLYDRFVNGATPIGILTVLKNDVLGMYNGMFLAAHLWYIFIFAFVVLLQPLISAAINYLDEHKNAWNIFIPLSFVMLVWNDFMDNKLLEFSHHTTTAFIPAVLMIFIGHWLYKYVMPKINIKTSFICLLVFLVAILLRTYAVAYVFKKTGSNHLLYWYSSFGVVCESSLSLFVVSLFKNCRSKFVNYIASLTFRIYLIHMFVVISLAKYDFSGKLLNSLSKIISNSDSLIYELGYTFVYALTVFVISAAISAVWLAISKLFYKIIDCIGKKQKN